VAAGIRDGFDPVAGGSVTGPASGRRARWPLAIGATVAAVYLAGAAMTARLNPLEGRALLDGGFLAPYNWVSPPPELAASNTPPSPASQSVPVSPEGGSEAVGISTQDLQVTLLLSKGAFPPREGQDSVEVRITPLAATDVGALPGGRRPQGNVYRIEATFQPGGEAVDRVQPNAQLVLVYPAPPNPGTFDGTIFVSSDERTWTALDTKISSARHQALATTPRLGYVVVGATPQPSPSSAATSGGSSQVVRILLIALLVLGAGAAAWVLSGRWLQRRTSGEEESWRGNGGGRP
jgi:hypothetical protein